MNENKNSEQMMAAIIRRHLHENIRTLEHQHLVNLDSIVRHR